LNFQSKTFKVGLIIKNVKKKIYALYNSIIF
jgi:hypothetical protein